MRGRLRRKPSTANRGDRAGCGVAVGLFCAGAHQVVWAAVDGPLDANHVAVKL